VSELASEPMSQRVRETVTARPRNVDRAQRGSAVSAMRAPVVAGVSGGVGTTTVAVGLRGHDSGRVTGHRPDGSPGGHRPDGSPDILVCRATLDSVRRAAAVLDEAGTEPPVLAVTLAGRVPRGPLRARMELLEPDAAALVLLPHVRRWCTLADPLAEAAQLLVEPVAQLPRPLRAYAAALRELVAAVAASGRLARDPIGEPDPLYSADRHVRRTGSAERPVRQDPSRPQVVGAFRAVEDPTRQGAGPARPAATSALPVRYRAPVVAAPATSRAPTVGGTPGPPQRRRGVRIVAPDPVAPDAVAPDAVAPDAVAPAVPQRPREYRAGAPAERVEQVG